MERRGIQLTAPKREDSVGGLNRILPGMEPLSPRVADDDILNRYEATLAAVFLLTQEDMAEAHLKAMHLEFPTPEERGSQRKDQPIWAIHLLADAMAFAARNGAKVHLTRDVFSRQFENHKFNWKNFLKENLDHTLTNHVSRSATNYTSIYKNYTISEVRPTVEGINLKTILKGLFHLSPHVIADGFPYTPLSVVRTHDHRKGMVFKLKTQEEILFLQTFNFDQPTDIDYAFISFNQELVQAVANLLKDDHPRNRAIEKEGYTIYQDGSPDLDPLEPVQSSPIMTRVQQIIRDENTSSLIWSSQFLPDVEDLRTLRRRLQDRSLRSVEIFAPDSAKWSTLYRLTGGNASKVLAEKMAREFPAAVALRYSTDRYLHAKLLIKNGTDLMITSHNFNRALVKARTSEIALEQRISAETLEGMERFYAELIRETVLFR